MRPTTFSRLMLVFVLIILICVSMVMGIFYFTMRDVQTRNRMDALKQQAYDIALLTDSLQTRGLESALGLTETSGARMLRYKLNTVYEEYKAYCMVVDRNGDGTAYFLSVIDDYPELREGFDAKSILSSLQKVLIGDEIVEQVQGPKGPMFTVAVPLEHAGLVLGAVYIQTAAQTVRASYEGLAIRVAGAALIAVLIAAVAALAYTRRLSKPLLEISRASTRMAQGDFSLKVSEEGPKEIHDLALSFNTMSEKLRDTEQTRREFIANLSHELRSPMTNIRGFIQGLVDGTVPPEEQAHYLGVVLDETNRLTKLVSGLLNLSRMENDEHALALSNFNINELVRMVLIPRIAQIEDKSIDVALDFAQESSLVTADRDQIEQVLINLLDNAIKFTPPGGHILIQTGIQDASTLQVRVRDDGVGVLPEDRPHIFERFYKADKAHTVGKGTGLGLAISRMIMERHKQTLTLEDTRQGASFVFTLKRSREAHVEGS
ncbi:MAG: ATP-binding protein [Christensenellales bacterium]